MNELLCPMGQTEVLATRRWLSGALTALVLAASLHPVAPPNTYLAPRVVCATGSDGLDGERLQAPGLPQLTERERICRTLFATELTLTEVNTGPRPGIHSESVSACAEGERPGTRQLFNFVRDVWHGSKDETEYTIFNCRAVAGTDSLSLHADSRAFDIGLSAKDPRQKIRGDQVFAWAINNAEVIGTEEVIWDGWAWTPEEGLQPYEGENPHTDHVHVGITMEAAMGLTPLFRLGILHARPWMS